MPEDHVIFSCKTIPTPTNIENRKKLEMALHDRHVRIFKDVHQSGHAAREDLRELVRMVKPKHIIPAHGEEDMKKALADLAIEKGYELGKTVHILHDGQKVRL